MSSDGEKTTPAKSRLCHIKKWDNFDGYGFNLHADKGKPGQYIGKVDDNSPAEAAGLRQGDRIIEVNGQSIMNKTHKQVVELIKSLTNETKLLVVDPHDETGLGNNILSSKTTNSSMDSLKSTGITDNNKQQQQQQQQQSATTNYDKEKNVTLNLKMTAAELRAQLASKKKFDPKKETMNFKQKFDIVQKL